MSSLVDDDLTRAATFFALAFGLTALGGLAIGELRVGIEYGLGLGVGFAVFAYFFLVPTTNEKTDDDATAEEPTIDSEE